MTLTFELDLDILPLYLHAKIQVCMSVRFAKRVRQTDGHTHRQTDNVKTITPDLSETGVKTIGTNTDKTIIMFYFN